MVHLATNMKNHKLPEKRFLVVLPLLLFIEFGVTLYYVVRKLI